VKTNDKCEDVVVIGVYHRRMGAWISFPPPPFLYYPPPFSKFSYKSFLFKIFIIIRFSSFDNISRRHTS